MTLCLRLQVVRPWINPGPQVPPPPEKLALVGGWYPARMHHFHHAEKSEAAHSGKGARESGVLEELSSYLQPTIRFGCAPALEFYETVQ